MVLQTTKVETTQDFNYKMKSNPSESVALGNKALGCVKKDYLTLYIPERINMDNILECHPPDFKYHKDYFVYILSLITSIASKKRGLVEKYDGYIPINKKILQKRVRNYRAHIDYLKERRVIYEITHYKVGEKSQCYKFTEEYESKNVPVQITKRTLIKSILKVDKNCNVKKTAQLDYLKSWFNEDLEVDFKKGVDYLIKEYRNEVDNPESKNPLLSFNCKLLPLQKLYRKEYDFYVDKSGERLHTNITQLKSELRCFLRYKGKRLSSVDISNAQPYLAIALLDSKIFKSLEMEQFITNPRKENDSNYLKELTCLIGETENKPDVLKFKQMVASGEFYEKFEQMLNESKLVELDGLIMDRKLVKEIALKTINSPNTHIWFNGSMKAFKKAFPNVYRVFQLIKKGKHNTLSIALQRLEANLVLHKACGFISKVRPDIPLYTLHDNIVTTVGNVRFVKSVLSKVLKKHIGVTPSLKVETW
ncbi:hypothetical protein [Seonamhaeicola sp. ML3]|uniref:hypothetical protein n=1 Tax=Seonamhaeicola sp. ML3 TaxID=2937786 RepID=UPI00200FC80A|nr:hypothetical protein [Seonamhaeicola sp. ML3]